MATTATVRKLMVEVADARNLLPKDGHGTSSPFVVVDYNGQRRRTQTVRCDLNPAWNETLEFSAEEDAAGAAGAGGDANVLEADVFHDRRVGPTRRNHFLGRVRLDSRQFVRKGEEALIYYPLEKKSFFSWIQGEIGFRIYYVDEEVPPPPPPPPTEEEEKTPPPPPPQPEAPESKPAPADPPAEAVSEAGKLPEIHSEPVAREEGQPPAVEAGKPDQPENQPPPPPPPPPPETEPPATPPPEATPPPPPENPPVTDPPPENPPVTDPPPRPEEIKSAPADPPPPPDPEKEAAPKWDPSSYPVDSLPSFERRERIFRRPLPETYERDPPERTAGGGVGTIERSSYDLVEKMHYLFVRVVKARYLPFASTPFVKLAVSSSGRQVRTETARKLAASVYEWDQVFAFGGTPLESTAMLEVSVWDPARKASDVDADFLGGVCFDVTEITTRDPPDSPLAPQWYRLEGGGVHRGDLMLATWIGTQADESFADAWKTDASGTQASRSKVYLSPKLWYLRVAVLEAQDFFPMTLTALTDTSFHVRAQLGFQVQKTRAAVSGNGSPTWNEDLLFVAAEPFGEGSVAFSVENRVGKEKTVFGVAEVPLSAVERRVDDRKVVSRWIDLESPGEKVGKRGGRGAAYNGRLHVRVCFDGGYHVMDEPAHLSSDFRPTARQLWRPPIGSVELGMVGCRNLVPLKTVAGKGTADAYAVAKYGEKWARSRTAADSLNPKWNEQYTWQVYDPCTVLTVAVFDSRSSATAAPHPDAKDVAARPDCRIGKVRIRVSTLEHGRVYKCTYPLLLLLPGGAKRMGEIDLAVRFVRSISAVDVLHLYARPILPRMHYVKPIGALHQEALRGVAARIVAVHLSRSEPPLPREVALYVLDADSQAFSMRRVRANWARIVSVLAGPIELVRWAEQTRTWRNPTATLMAHALLVLLVWHPDLAVPTAAFYAFGVGAWNYRGRARGPAAGGPCARLSQVEGADREELDEEFDPAPSSRPAEVVRARYDRLRAMGVRVQSVLGDVATQGERVQALVTWRDPRATLIFVGMCLAVAVVLYAVPAKMVAVAGGFYYLRHPMFRDRMPPPALNFFRRLPSLSDRIM